MNFTGKLNGCFVFPGSIGMQVEFTEKYSELKTVALYNANGILIFKLYIVPVNVTQIDTWIHMHGKDNLVDNTRS